MSETRCSESGRWWEFYAVRYFVGSVFGALVIAFVGDENKVIGDLISPIWSADADSSWLGMLSIGLAFGYIASAPILLLHAIRFRFAQNYLLPSAKFVCLLIATLCGSALGAYFLVGINKSHVFFGVTLGLFIVVLMFLAAAVMIFDAAKGRACAFYCSLSRERSNNSSARREYVESYRHLREHGNAFMIVFFEICLGSAIYFIEDGWLLVMLVSFWVLPGASVWLLASTLETSMIKAPCE